MHLETAMEVARDFRARLQEVLGERLVQVRLFGSQARGTARAGSDLDLLVLVGRRDREIRRHVSEVADEVTTTHDYQFDVSPLVMEEAQFQHLLARERRIALDIVREGCDV